MTEKIPKEWIQTKLEHVINKMCNGLTKRQNKEGKGFTVSRIETISMGRIDYNKVGFVENVSEEVIEKYKLIVGDILFSHINSDFHLGKTAIVNSTRKELLHGMNLLLIRVNRNILIPLFLHYLFNYCRYAGSFIKIAQHAVNQSSLNQAKLKNLDVTLPPLPEQQKIVEKIEELFTKLDAGVEALKKVKEQIKQYRQSVLKSAFEGKLTADWRQRMLNDELRVLNEKENNSKLKNLPELPEGWKWKEFKEVTEIVLGQSPPSSTYNNEGLGLPFFQGKAEFQELYPEIKKWCSSPKKIAEKGDVLISVRAPVGPTNISPAKSCIGRGLAAIKPNEQITSKYILYICRAFKNDIAKESTGTTFKAITGSQLKSFKFPYAKIDEQQKIVEEIEKRFSIADEVEKTVDKSLEQAEKLRQSILKKAFEGKLTEKWREQHPELVSGENSAEKLLEKIKKEKEKLK